MTRISVVLVAVMALCGHSVMSESELLPETGLNIVSIINIKIFKNKKINKKHIS